MYVVIGFIGSAFLLVTIAWLRAHFEYRRLAKEQALRASAMIQETFEQIERLKNETTRDSELFIKAKAEYQAKLLDYRNRFGGPSGNGDSGSGPKPAS